MAHRTERQTQTRGSQTGSERGAGTSVQRSDRTTQGGNGGQTALARRGLFAGTPFDMMRRMSDDMAQLLDLLARPGLTTTPGDTVPATADLAAAATWIPRVELIQRPDALVVQVELAGVQADDINVAVSDGMLTIWGEREQTHREERDGVIRSERTYGRFQRVIPLPEGADEDNVTGQHLSTRDALGYVVTDSSAPLSSAAVDQLRSSEHCLWTRTWS